jgi:hypothetical protein
VDIAYDPRDGGTRGMEAVLGMKNNADRSFCFRRQPVPSWNGI